MKESFVFEKVNTGAAEFTCLNDIQCVIEGKLPPDEKKLLVDAANYSYGLGNGAISRIYALGESIIINGVAYTKSTDSSSVKYYQLDSGKNFLTSWIFALSPNSLPQWRVSLSKTASIISIMHIYEAIFDKIQKPFVVTGVINFAKLEETAIAKAPIENENIFEHKDLYYPYSSEQEDICAAIVGVAANIAMISDSTLCKAIKKVVYFNPLEAASKELTTHEHVLLLNKTISSIEEVTVADATDVEHLFTNSIVKSFHLNVYQIDHINCIDDFNVE